MRQTREHGALHHLIRSDQRRFGLSAGTGAAINVGSAYRLFFDVVPLRASRTEGLSGQYTIGATDSYNAKLTRGPSDADAAERALRLQLIDREEKQGLNIYFGLLSPGFTARFRRRHQASNPEGRNER